MKIPLVTCRKRLTILWFTGSLVLLIIFILQTVFGHYGDRVSEAWGWLLPTFMPTISLIMSVWVVEVSGKGSEDKTVDKFFYRISFALSWIYLLLVGLAIFLQPYAQDSLKLMSQSNFWLGPLQGFVTASIGVIFFFRE